MKEDRTVDKTKPTCFALLGVVQTTGPIHGDVALIPAQARSSL